MLKKVTFVVKDEGQAVKEGWPHPYLEIDEVDDYNEEYGLWKCIDGKPVEFITSDGGEPEDNTFYRNWSWVAPYMTDLYEEAYKAGYKDGIDNAY